MKLLRGKAIADKILRRVSRDIKKEKIKPGLAVILVGRNKVSEIYVKLKAKVAQKSGLFFRLFNLPSRISETEIIGLIKKLNADKKINGIIVQLPLPEKYNTSQIISSISLRKDADGFHPKNIKKFLSGKKGIEPVFLQAIVKLLESSKVKLKNKKAVVIANSEIFGAVMAQALKRKKINAQVILKSDFDKRINLLKKADIVITAVGKPKLIKGAMIKKRAIIIDGGINKKNGKICGDADFDSLAKTAGYLSPVPGGVGPVTVACLLRNTYRLLKKEL